MARPLRWLVRLLVLVTGAAIWWRYRQDMNPDGVNYVEIADGVARGDWVRLLNTYWSPLFPLLIAAVRRVVGMDLAIEVEVAHFTQLLAWGLAWIALERLVEASATVSGLEEGPGRADLLLVAGSAYTWYASEHLALILTPDLLLTALVLTVAREAVLLAWGAGGSAVRFGLGLGLAYLAKAIVLPGAFVVLGAVLVVSALRRRLLPGLLPAALAFGLVAGPWVGALSLHAGRLTTGDAGRLNYGWYVCGWHGNVFWSNGPRPDPRFGVPVHPVESVFTDPEVRYARGPIDATLPVGLDPAPWDEGLRIRFDLRRQLRRVGAGLPVLRDALLSGYGAIATALPLVALPGAWRRGRGRLAWLSLPFLAVIGLYLCVHLEGRLVAPFWVPVAVLVAALGLEPILGGWVARSAAALLLLFLVPTLHHSVLTAPRQDGWALALADVTAAGVRPGMHVAVVNVPISPYVYRRARVSILADVRTTPVAYCALPAERQAALEERLRELDLDAIVLEGPTPQGCSGFRRSGRYLVKTLGPA